MVSSDMILSDEEKQLLDAIRDVNYGEIYGVEIISGNPKHHVQVSANAQDLIEAIRDGQNSISVLTIHQGEPVMAETDYKRGRLHCRKKTKFPTN
jgi:hypothetical protein